MVIQLCNFPQTNNLQNLESSNIYAACYIFMVGIKRKIPETVSTTKTYVVRTTKYKMKINNGKMVG